MFAKNCRPICIRKLFCLFSLCSSHLLSSVIPNVKEGCREILFCGTKQQKIPPSHDAHTVPSGTLAPSPCLGASTSSHTPGCPEAAHDEESEAVVTQRRHTGCLNPSSLDPAPLKRRGGMSGETEAWEGGVHVGVSAKRPFVSDSNSSSVRAATVWGLVAYLSLTG